MGIIPPGFLKNLGENFFQIFPKKNIKKKIIKSAKIQNYWTGGNRSIFEVKKWEK